MIYIMIRRDVLGVIMIVMGGLRVIARRVGQMYMAVGMRTTIWRSWTKIEI